jgi:hypothetical protein
MRIKYKKVKIPMPHCGDCGEMMLGNNSYISPYNCKCGTWEMEVDLDGKWEFVLKPVDNSNTKDETKL